MLRYEYDPPEAPEHSLIPESFGSDAPEATPPPEEYASGAVEERDHRRAKRFRFSGNAILAVLAVFALALAAKPMDAAEAEADVVSEAAVEPVAVIDEPEPEAEPAVTAMPGDLELTIDYAILDGDTVEYLYSFDRHEVDYPITIYAKITDSFGNTAAPEYDPDVWDSSRSRFTYTMDVTGLSGDMTLEITAVFTRDGAEKSVTAVHSVIPKPPAAQTDASVVVTSADESSAVIDYEAHFIPDPADPVDYDLVITGFGIGWYGGDGTRQGYSRGVWEEDTEPSVTRTQDGWAFAYSGPAAINAGPDGAELFTIVLDLYDSATGVTFTVETDPTVIPDNSLDEPEITTYPLGDGTIYVTVYNNTFDMNAANDPDDPYSRVLLRQQIPEAEFTELALPAAEFAGEDFVFEGYVIHYNNVFDRGYDRQSELSSFVLPLGDTLTQEDVERIPVSSDGIRYVNIHAMWRSQVTDEIKMPLVLDDGMGNAVTYEGDTPFASEGYAYLAAYPIPEREGYTFTGWYDADGNLVEAVAYTDFLDAIDAGDYIDYDWSNPHPVTLYAGWS